DAEQTSLYATYAPTQPSVPVNTALPTITGTAEQGQTLTEHNGTWSNEPTSFAYQWLQCDSAGNNCQPISEAKGQTYVPGAGDVGHMLRVQETASNAAGPSSPANSNATAAVVPPVPVNTALPTITGTAQQGQTLTEHNGTWSNEPTSFAHQWLQCDSSGNTCKPIGEAIGQTYVLVVGDVGHTIRVQETASNTAGPSTPANSNATAAVVPPVPTNTALPTITGTAQQGQTLTEVHGTWTNGPTSYTYQWLQCESMSSSCLPISGAKAQTYVPVALDVGHTIEVQETAKNAGGASSPATSAATAVVSASASATFGKTTVGGSSDHFVAERKRVNRYALGSAGSVSKLSIYLAPTGTSGQQVLKGLIYADSSGAPGALLGVSEQLTFTGTSSAGWYDLVFSSPVKLAAGNYWIGVITGASAGVTGFRFDSVTGSRDYNTNTYSSGPTNPFGAFTTDAEQTSLYATYSPG
ncbi:MAG: large repetitive protein, partial [Solirubrobacteraceae bacterium]|nr:large repetitive protein [Solirubrobacteraceae bacterium]